MLTQNRRIILNILATSGRTLVGVACGIFSVRWVLMALGHEDFGLFGVVGSLAIFVTFFNTQFSGAIGRFYAFSIGRAKVAKSMEAGLEECQNWFFNLPQNDKTDQADFSISKPVHLLYLGRQHPLKGIEYLEKAVAGLPGVELRIMSDAKGEELERVWQWCEVLVLPTLSENFGRVIAEALERGKRVITTDGAPAWNHEIHKTHEKGVWRGYDGRLIYLKGFRDGTNEERVGLLKKAIEMLIQNAKV